MTNAPAFTSWLDDFFAAYYQHRPVNATFIGVHAHDDRLPDYSEGGLGDALSDTDTLLARLRDLPNEQLSAAETLDRKLALGFLDIQRWELQSRHFQRGNPCAYTGEATFGVIGLFRRPATPLAARVEAATRRMEAISALLGQAQANLREHVRRQSEPHGPQFITAHGAARAEVRRRPHFPPPCTHPAASRWRIRAYRHRRGISRADDARKRGVSCRSCLPIER